AEKPPAGEEDAGEPSDEEDEDVEVEAVTETEDGDGEDNQEPDVAEDVVEEADAEVTAQSEIPPEKS
ncbi:hypothetical protein ACFL6M_07855, partial [Candidatus Eisenbacteria bacterium]